MLDVGCWIVDFKTAERARKRSGCCAARRCNLIICILPEPGVAKRLAKASRKFGHLAHEVRGSWMPRWHERRGEQTVILL
jgi:hypothetical protein